MKPIRALSFFLTVILLLCSLVSCRSRPPADFSYRFGSLAVRLEGNRGGQPLSCDIYCENGSLKTISYRTPDPLEGVTVSVTEDGEYRVSGNGFSVTVSQDSYALLGLLRPVRILLLDGGRPPQLQSVQRLATGDLFTLSVPDENFPVTLTLNADGFPIFASGNDFSFRITPSMPDA